MPSAGVSTDDDRRYAPRRPMPRLRLHRALALTALASSAAACAAAPGWRAPPPGAPRGPGMTPDQVAASVVARSEGGHEPLAPVAPLGHVPEDEPGTETHRRHPGEIVFTGKDLRGDAGPLEEGDLRSAFALGDLVAMRAYLGESMENALRRAGVSCRAEVVLELGPDGAAHPWFVDTVDAGTTRWTPRVPLLGVPVVVPWKREAAPDRFAPELLGVRAAMAASALGEGDHRFALALRIRCRGWRDGEVGTYAVTVARGAFALHVAPGAVAAYRASFGPSLAPSAHHEADTLRPRARRAAEVMPFQPLALSLPRGGWELVHPTRFESGRAPLSRWTDVMMTRRRPDGGCEVVQATLREDADVPGSTRWDGRTLRIDLMRVDPEELPCERARTP